MFEKGAGPRLTLRFCVPNAAARSPRRGKKRGPFIVPSVGKEKVGFSISMFGRRSGTIFVSQTSPNFGELEKKRGKETSQRARGEKKGDTSYS